MLKHEKYRKMIKNVQIVEPCRACGSSSTRLFSYSRGGATWCNIDCNKPTSTAATTCHDDGRPRPPSSFVWQKTSKTSTETTLRLNALPVVTSIHIDSQRTSESENTIPYHSIPFLPCKGKDKLSSTPRTSKTWVFAYFADRSRPNIALLTGTQTPTLRTFSAKCTSDTCPSHVWVSPAGLAFHLLSCWCFCMVHKRGDWSRMQRLRGLKSHGQCVCVREKNREAN